MVEGEVVELNGLDDGVVEIGYEWGEEEEEGILGDEGFRECVGWKGIVDVMKEGLVGRGDVIEVEDVGDG